MHNIPRLYGDKTVRPNEKVTGIQSGLKAAGMAPLMGLYDGVTGMVTQPIRGGKEEGALGVLKGMGKGMGGALVKPVAGIFGSMGYLHKGLWKEAQNKVPKAMGRAIRSARIEQGVEELKTLGEHEKKMVLRKCREQGEGRD